MKFYVFTDNTGKQIVLPGNATLGDLIRAGIVKEVRLKKPEETLPDGWVEHTGELPETSTPS